MWVSPLNLWLHQPVKLPRQSFIGNRIMLLELKCSVTRVAQELVKDGEGLACPLRNPCDPNVTENLAPAARPLALLGVYGWMKAVVNFPKRWSNSFPSAHEQSFLEVLDQIPTPAILWNIVFDKPLDTFTLWLL
ncbi:hypothetical protein CB1_001073082 [Camelus ferus]|nr:hypothetical protein CB1_001073082 [Camelus ferus]